MTVEQPTDVRAEAILKGLSELQTLLEEPITRHALDLTNNAKTAHQHNVLNRTHRSLTQYLKLEGDLFYIGLLGHFSTGKSSTINSVLDTWDTGDERPTDLNPTDDTITLVTRQANEKFLLGVIREGTVTIRSKPIENALLDNIVLVDTPGTGDPALLEEIARDFLPVCDVILFFLSAASPLDKDDMPLLEELHKRLAFPQFSEIANSVRTQVAATEKKLRPQVTRINDLKIPSPETNYTILDTLVATEGHSAAQDIFRELRDDVGLFLGSLEAKLSGIVVEKRRAYEKEISEARKRRRLLYVVASLVGIACGAVTYLAYVYAVDIPQNTFHAVLWNIVAQLIWAPLAFFAAKAVDNFPKRSITIKRDYQTMLRRDLEKTTEKEIDTYEFPAISTPTLTKRLGNAYQSLMDCDPDSWNMVAAERLNALRELQSEFSKTRTECIELVETVTDKSSSYFSDATKNLQLLNEVADKIKARAIEPSFKLLGDTRETLHRVRQQVHEVEFG